MEWEAEFHAALRTLSEVVNRAPPKVRGSVEIVNEVKDSDPHRPFNTLLSHSGWQTVTIRYYVDPALKEASQASLPA